MAKWPLCLIAGKVRHVRVDGPGDELSCEYYTRDCGIPKFAPSPKTCGGCSVHKLSLRAEAWKAEAERLVGGMASCVADHPFTCHCGCCLAAAAHTDLEREMEAT